MIRIQNNSQILWLEWISGNLEVTVDFLMEVDKLVQLIESPIFTCESQLSTKKKNVTLSITASPYSNTHASFRPPSSVTGCRAQPLSHQSFVWPAYAASSESSISTSVTSAQLCSKPWTDEDCVSANIFYVGQPLYSQAYCVIKCHLRFTEKTQKHLSKTNAQLSLI